MGALAPCNDEEDEQNTRRGFNLGWHYNETMPQIELFLRQLERGKFAEERMEAMREAARVR